MLWKTDLRASEPKDKAKTEFDIQRNQSFIALGAKETTQAMAFKNCKPSSGGWGWGGLWGLTGSSRFWPELYRCYQPPSSFLEGGTGFLKQKAKKGGGELCKREEKDCFRIEFR